MSALTIGSQTLKQMIAYTSYAAARDDSRPVLGGLHFRVILEGEGPVLHVEATDGFRLAIASAPCECETFEKALVPREGVAALVKQIGKHDEPLTLTLLGSMIEETAYQKGEPDENGHDTMGTTVKTGRMVLKPHQIDCAGAHVALTSRLIDGTFPEVSSLVPVNDVTEVGVRRDVLLEAVKRCEIFAKQNNDVIKFDLAPARDDRPAMTVSATAAELGGATEEIVQSVSSGKENVIAFNCGYVRELLACAPYESVAMRVKGPNNAGVFVPYTGNGINAVAVIMPMHLAA